MQHIFIINPISGTGKYKEVERWLKRHFANSADDYEIHYTEKVGHASEIASRYGDDSILYSVGGDGTAHEILNGMNDTAQLAIVPVGTGNDFWRMIDFEGSIEDLLDQTVGQGRMVSVDVGSVNGIKFLNCSNIGIDADINVRVNNIRNKWFPRKLIYIYGALRELMHMKPVVFEVETENGVEQKSITLTSIMNGKWYGNGFKSAPEAMLNDGLFDVCFVESVGVFRALNLIVKYMKGTHVGEKEVEIRRLESLTIRSKKPINFGCDGEVSRSTEMKYQILQGNLKLRIPQNTKNL